MSVGGVQFLIKIIFNPRTPLSFIVWQWLVCIDLSPCTWLTASAIPFLGVNTRYTVHFIFLLHGHIGSHSLWGWLLLPLFSLQKGRLPERGWKWRERHKATHNCTAKPYSCFSKMFLLLLFTIFFIFCACNLISPNYNF